MEKPPHREEDENLLVKQEQERADLRDEAHGEALAMNQTIGGHEQETNELKVTPGPQIEKSASQEKLKYKIINLPNEMVGKRVGEVYEYLKKTYGEEKLAKIPERLYILPVSTRYGGELNYFFGSFADKNYAMTARWVNGRWDDQVSWPTTVFKEYNIVLLED